MIYEVQKGTLKTRINIQELEFPRKKKERGSKEGSQLGEYRREPREACVYGFSQRTQPLATSYYPSFVSPTIHLLAETYRKTSQSKKRLFQKGFMF